ncbi:RNA-binding (RRM/RBD/RNP motifs) family protein [Striga asiatica]|uniref:RNA-binding (RRM/RBD/RNP motifs) family protein n=1 Tax=Striga asiatica TaxID=4170 RepID=A0A5A7QDX4_STRAF|nr:RNA-binding (RRM/RBD/RNP motifs) family protein [Striga asiatica]
MRYAWLPVCHPATSIRPVDWRRRAAYEEPSMPLTTIVNHFPAIFHLDSLISGRSSHQQEPPSVALPPLPSIAPPSHAPSPEKRCTAGLQRGDLEVGDAGLVETLGQAHAKTKKLTSLGASHSFSTTLDVGGSSRLGLLAYRRRVEYWNLV